jgi:hypothetical protein
MAIDFSTIGATPAHTGKIDFSAIGGIPAVGQDEPTDETTTLGAAGRGAASMLPLGTQALAATAGAFQNEPYLQERQEIEKETQADIANHPVARVAGQAAGIVAPAIATAGSSVPESLLGAVGQGAAIGAGFGAGNAVDTLASGGSGLKAAEDVALGTSLGAAGGAAGKVLGGVLGKGATGLEEFGTKKAGQAMNLAPQELGNMTEAEWGNFQQFVKQQELLGKGPQEMFDNAKAVQDQFGSKIGEIRGQANGLGLKTDVKPLVDALDAKYQAADALANPDERKAANFYKRGMADILAMARQNLPEGGEGIADTLENMRQAGINVASEHPVPNEITFDQLQRLKKSYGNSAFENGAIKNQAAADVYFSIKDGMQRIVDDAQANPNLGQEYKDALKGYSQISPIVDGLEQRVGAERAGVGGGNVASNAVMGGAMIGMGRGAFGARQLLRSGFGMAPETMARGANATAAGLNAAGAALPAAGAQIGGANAPTTLNVDHPAMAQWKPIFQKNAQNAKDAGEVQKANAVTDFVLSQRDPAYAAAKQKMSDNPSPAPTEPNPTKMADGGVVPEGGITEPIPAMGSTLQGLADQLKHPTHEKVPVPMEDVPANKPQDLHQSFNPDFSDKLKAFLKSQKEGAGAQSR